MPLSPLLLLHICAGTLGLLSGTVAVSVRKGFRRHAVAGSIFSMSMLTLATTGAYIGLLKNETGNLIGGIVTFYMIATAWTAARRRVGLTNNSDWFAFVVALALGASCVTYGYRVAHGQTVIRDGVPAGMDFFFGFVVLLAAAGDIRMLARGGLSHSQRISRHLWRMCFGLFVASGSFFMGRQQIFPFYVRRSGILIFLTVLPLFLLIFWLLRVRYKNLYRTPTNSRDQINSPLQNDRTQLTSK